MSIINQKIKKTGDRKVCPKDISTLKTAWVDRTAPLLLAMKLERIIATSNLVYSNIV